MEERVSVIVGKGHRPKSPLILLSHVAPAIDARLMYDDGATTTTCIHAADWVSVSGLGLLARAAMASQPATDGQTTRVCRDAERLRDLIDDQGHLHGRACIVSG